MANKNFANISDQIKFIDTLKYYQKSLSVLASIVTGQEKPSVKNKCEKFIKNDQKLSKKFYKCMVERSSGKEIIPYEMITRFDSINITMKMAFFSLITFTQALKVASF